LVGFDGCREHTPEAFVVHPCQKLAQQNECSFGCRIAAQSSALVLRKNPKVRLPSCTGSRRSISAAIASTANLSALSKVTAKRKNASCQARNVLACHSPPEAIELMESPLQ